MGLRWWLVFAGLVILALLIWHFSPHPGHYAR
jgi:hypothetical protein